MAIVVITDKPAQLGNQLWAFLNMTVLVKGYKKKSLLFLEDKGFEQFELVKDKSIYALTKGTFLFSCWNYIIRFVRYRYQNPFWKQIFSIFCLHFKTGFIDEKTFERDIKRVGFLFVESWPNRLHKNLPLMSTAESRALFSFEKKLLTKVSSFLEQVRQSANLIVGIHIRRGDYKYFQEGKYYFEDEVYLDYMQQLKNLFPEKNISFFIASNEPFDQAYFASVNCFQIAGALPTDDLCGLSLCDYILGPMSTFSMWASYTGKVPLRFIETRNELLRLVDFKPVAAQDCFDPFIQNC